MINKECFRISEILEPGRKAESDGSLTPDMVDFMRKYGLLDGGDGVEVRAGGALDLLPGTDRIDLRLGRSGKSAVPDDEGEVSDPEFEKKHPRDEYGRFVKKDEEGDAEASDEGNGDKYSFLDTKPWPGAETVTIEDEEGTAVVGLGGKFEIDGHEYTIVGPVSKEEVVAFHEMALKVYDRGSEFYGQELVKIPTVLMPYDPRGSGMAMLLGNPFTETEDDGIVTMDTGLVDSPEYLESTIFHEVMHGQPRSQRPGTNANLDFVSLYAEEAFNGLLDQAYSEKYGLPLMIGWPNAVAPIVAAAQENGWSKQKLYDFAIDVHKVNGAQYYNMTRLLLRGTGVKLDQDYSVLDKWYPDWRSERRGWHDVYGITDPGFVDPPPPGWPMDHSSWDNF